MDGYRDGGDSLAGSIGGQEVIGSIGRRMVPNTSTPSRADFGRDDDVGGSGDLPREGYRCGCGNRGDAEKMGQRSI